MELSVETYICFWCKKGSSKNTRYMQYAVHGNSRLFGKVLLLYTFTFKCFPWLPHHSFQQFYHTKVLYYFTHFHRTPFSCSFLETNFRTFSIHTLTAVVTTKSKLHLFLLSSSLECSVIIRNLKSHKIT